MSIHFISGKPGGGKTLYGVRMIVDEIVRGSRPVVTNVSLRLGELNHLLQTQHPKFYEREFTAKGIHITDRVQILTEDDLSTFFTFRHGSRVANVPNEEWKSGIRPDYSVVTDAGIFYVLDEVHIAFNSRAWATTGHQVLYYLSQHRKLGDDVICITQSIGNVDKQFRSVAQDFTYIKNLSKQKIGLFKLPAVFTRNTFLEPASENSKPVETGTFKLDVSGLASCYDTAKGVGIHGRGADTKERKKGIHWAVALVGFPIILYLVLHFSPKLIAHFVAPKMPPQQTNSVSFSPLPVSPQAPALLPSHSSRTMNEKQSNGRSETEQEITCTGYVLDGVNTKAFLSDGRIATPDDELESINKKFIIVSGRKIRILQSPLRPVPSANARSYETYDNYQAARSSETQQNYQPVETYEVPVNQVSILPGIHGQGGNPQPRVSGFSQMQQTGQNRQNR